MAGRRDTSRSPVRVESAGARCRIARLDEAPSVPAIVCRSGIVGLDRVCFAQEPRCERGKSESLVSRDFESGGMNYNPKGHNFPGRHPNSSELSFASVLGLRLPNHVHGIVIIEESLVRTRHAVSPRKDVSVVSSRKDVQLNVHTKLDPSGNVQARKAADNMSAISPQRGSLSVIVRTFKAAVTTECRRQGFEKFEWLPRFYEHIYPVR